MRTSLACWAIALSICGPAVAQTPSADPSLQDPPTTTLEDVIVDGERLEEAVRRYVETVSAPPQTRGIARWDGPVCVEAVNFQPGLEAEIEGRIRQVAGALDLTVEAPGCDPNIVVLGTDDGSALARAMVDRFRSRFFRLGYTRSNRGSDALEAFANAASPVRWWHVSLPVHAVTGAPMIRLPGKDGVSLPCYSRSTATYDASVAHLGGARTGERCNGVADRMLGLWIVVDANASAGLSAAQLSDYLAFVAMAQVEPEADTSRYDTVLNLFQTPDAVSGITGWDEGYLRALYSGETERLDAREQAQRMVATLPADARP